MRKTGLNRNAIMLLFPILLFGSFVTASPSAPLIDSPTTDSVSIRPVFIDVDTRYQTMESFMASDCWMPNIVGQDWDKKHKENIAKLLFSSKITKGSPEGIGLSGWRFVLGGGSYNQGDSSNISQIDRRGESFMDPQTGEIDWTRQRGQRYFLKKAKKYGVNNFVLFSISPPAFMTKNGKAYSSAGAHANLKEDYYDDFADYMTETVKQINKKYGINFNFISPLNEPQYDWEKPAQEGSGWQNEESYRLIRELDASITKKRLQTNILFGEAVSYKYLLHEDDKPNRGHLIQDFFTSTGKYSLLKFPNVASVATAHSYWLDGDWATLKSIREDARDAAKSANIRLFQTEWSMLGDHYHKDEFVGFEQASYMDIALYLAKVIHADLAYADVSSWSYWTSMDVDRYNHKNRFLLIELHPKDGVFGNVREGGDYSPTASLWVLGNYSLFIRPGYVRVKMDVNNKDQDVFGTSYISPDKKTLVSVYTNNSEKSQTVSPNLDVSSLRSIYTYTTSAHSKLNEEQQHTSSSKIKLPAKSVVTVKYNYR